MTMGRRVALVRWSTVLVVVAVWELVARGPLAGNEYVTAPSRIVSDGLPFVFQGDVLEAFGVTTGRFLAAFAISTVVGTVIGVFLGRLHQAIFRGARDVVSVLYALPQVPFYPLFVLWLGIGTRSEIAFGAAHGILPVILITMTAAARTQPSLLDASLAMGAGRIARTRLVVIPAVLPDIVSAAKIGAALSLLGVLLGQLMISVDGVATVLSAQISNHQAARLDAVILVVCAGAVAVNVLLGAVERRLSPNGEA
jgi:NitT/TauT family transport system permease protein